MYIEIQCTFDFSEGDPSVYSDFYRSLKDFIENSLDIHKVKKLS